MCRWKFRLENNSTKCLNKKSLVIIPAKEPITRDRIHISTVYEMVRIKVKGSLKGYLMTEVLTPNFYAIIPANVRYCKELEANAKLLYGEITALANQYGFCWASNQYFADLYDVDIRTVKRWIESLNKNNFINVEITKKGIISSRKIFIIQEIYTKGQKCQDEGTKMSNTRGQKCHPNNTSINNTKN